MRMFRILLSCLAFAGLPAACGGGGGGGGSGPAATVDPAQWAGTWQVRQVLLSTTCTGPGVEAEFPITISLSGAQALVDFGFGLTLDVVGGRLRGIDAFSGGVEYDLGLASADAFTGTRRTPIPTSPACEYLYEWQGTRIGAAQPSELDLEGTWDVTESLLSSTCALPGAPPRTYELTITASGATAALVQPGLPAFVLPVVGERLVGAVGRAGVTASYDVGPVGKDAIAGTVTLSFAGLGTGCAQIYDLTATRVGP